MKKGKTLFAVLIAVTAAFLILGSSKDTEEKNTLECDEQNEEE